jgi:hypothetical protein
VLFVDVARMRDVRFVREFIRDEAGARVPESLEDFVAATDLDPVETVEQVMIGRSGPDSYLAAVRLRIDPRVIEEYLRTDGTPTETHLGRTLFLPDPESEDGDWAVAFYEQTALVGPADAVRDAIDRIGSGPTALDNAELMAAIGEIEPGSQVWGSFTDLLAPELVPEGVAPPVAADLITALERVNYQMRVDTGVTARLAGDFSTLDAARRAGDLLRGFVAFGKMGSTGQPDMMELLNGLRVDTLEDSVEINFTATEELIDRIAASDLLNRQTD